MSLARTAAVRQNLKEVTHKNNLVCSILSYRGSTRVRLGPKVEERNCRASGDLHGTALLSNSRSLHSITENRGHPAKMPEIPRP